MEKCLKCLSLYHQAQVGKIGMMQFVSFCESAALFGHCNLIERYIIDRTYQSLLRKNIPLVAEN